MSDSDDSDLDSWKKNLAGSFRSAFDKIASEKIPPKKKRGNLFNGCVNDSNLSTPQTPQTPEIISDIIDLDDGDSNPAEKVKNNASILNEDSPIEILDDEMVFDNMDEDAPIVERLRSKRKVSRRTIRKKPVVKDPIDLDKDDDDSFSFRISQDFTLDDEEDYNPEILVKILWRNKEPVHKVPIRKFQKIEALMEYFAKLEDLPTQRIQLLLNGVILKSTDTPESLDLKITDFLEGGVINEASTTIPVTDRSKSGHLENSILLKIIQKDVKEPLSILLKKTDKMRILFIKIGEELNLKEDQFKLSFDGDIVEPNDSPESLDLEGGECFDLKLL